jgi:hypothetical protein
MDTWNKRLFARMKAVLGREVTDDELDTFSYADEEDAESYLNGIRAQRMLETCNARELECFLDANLLDVSGDSLSDPEHAFILITLLEFVMPDVDKMKVAIAACPRVDASHDITYKNAMDPLNIVGCNDMLGRYLACGGNETRAVDLLLGTAESHFIHGAHLACVSANTVNIPYTPLYSHIESIMYSLSYWEQCVREVAVIRAQHRSRRARARLCVMVCCVKWKVLALRARERVFAPGGAGFLVLRQRALENGMCE